jgi:hypothetical protein
MLAALVLSLVRPSILTQVYRLTEPAQAFGAAFHGTIHDIQVAPGQALTAEFWNSLGPADRLAVWLDDAHLSALKTGLPVYGSANLTAGRATSQTPFSPGPGPFRQNRRRT